MNEHKIVLIGGIGVGKSSITIQFVSQNFITCYDPTIEDSYRKQLKVDDEACLLDILDTAGQEEYSCARDQYMRNCNCFIVVYSITSRNSFNQIETYLKQIQHVSCQRKVPIVLVGNKSDLTTREVSYKEGKALAKSVGCSFYETSAKTASNVNEIFCEAVRKSKNSRDAATHKKKTCEKQKFYRKTVSSTCSLL